MQNVTVQGIIILLVLVGSTMLMNKRLELKLNKRIALSVVRMGLQLGMVGLYLNYIFTWNNPWINTGYMLIMMSIAALTTYRNFRVKDKKLLLMMLVSIMIPNASLVFIFNKYVVALNNVFDARFIITISGMLLGNVLSGAIITLNNFYDSVKENKEVINYELSLGATRIQSVKRFILNALSASITPTIASIATIGLVALPGMMTGQILGGSIPTTAVLYQMAIMLAIYVARYYNSLLIIVLTMPVMFNEKDQLKSNPN